MAGPARPSAAAGPAPSGAPRRAGRLVTFWALPVRLTPAFLAAQPAANAWAGSAQGPLPPPVLLRGGVSVEAVLGRGELWRLLSATFLAHGPGMLARQLAFAGLVVGAHEALLGPGLTAAAFAALDAGAALAVLVPGTEGLAALHGVGMPAGGFGLLGSLAAGARWRRAILLGAFLALLAKVALAFEPVADGVHVLAFLAGYGLRLGLAPR